MGRTSRTAPLPDVSRGNVPDAATQRVVTAIVTSLQAVLKFLKPYAEPEPWRYLLYEAGWADYATTRIYQRGGVRKDALGRVHLRGLVARTSGASTVIGVLPLGYRPAMRSMFAAYSDTGVARVDVAPNGEVVLVAGGTTYLSLDGINFDTEA